MLYYFLFPLREHFGPFRVFGYISFRAAGAAVTALLVAFLVGPMLIRWLQRMQIHQGARRGTPDSHAEKGATPSMGGFIILAATLVPTLLWMRLDNRYVQLALLAMLWMGAIGFLDDYLKLRQKRQGKENLGLVERWKLAGQVTLGIALGVYLWQFPLNPLPGASTTLPFVKGILVVPATIGMAWLYVPFVTFVMTGTSNAVNLADGLDGLAAGLIAIAIATFAIFAYAMGRVDASAYLQLFYLRGAGELTVFCSAVFGAAIGFLWFNCHPAQVIMGDTGALALGGALGAVAILLKSEFLVVFIGGVFMVETLSVLVQRGVFKYRKRRRGLAYAQAHRVFLRAPLHHHFELKGWPEAQVVVRFWILGILCAFVALTTLKLR
ncbi:MAG TPA: phospho-N-acetylmuramoyl-pentapeptide-transferase [Gemmatimonadaceae bacterium]|nr:phospho-N-acetylmuramoyl-pentapeptide-transferase [Gemmatimonadaceae bacterium]